LLRCPSALTQKADAQSIVALGQPFSRLIPHKITVIVLRGLQTKGAINENLSSRRPEQICTAHDFDDSHCRIVDDNSELIGRNVVATPD